MDTCLHVQREEKGENDTPWLTDDMIRAVILDTIGGGKRSLALTLALFYCVNVVFICLLHATLD